MVNAFRKLDAYFFFGDCLYFVKLNFIVDRQLYDFFVLYVVVVAGVVLENSGITSHDLKLMI
jgi:hypothetical protein